MAEESAKLRIPYIAAAQAQKHVTHNEAMTLLDTLVQLSVLDKDLTAPPGSPAEGDTYIVAGGGGTATGAWVGWEKRVVRYIDGMWRSYLPGAGSGAGWLAWIIDEDAMYRFDGTAWALAGIEGPAGADGGLKLTFNSATSGDPGSGKFLFNNASFASATAWHVSKTDGDGNGIGALLATLDDSTSANKTLVVLKKQDAGAFFFFWITGALTDQGAYDTFPITPVAALGSIANNNICRLLAIRTGDKGDTGTTGATGPAGAAGADGSDPGILLTWDTGTSDADPGAGKLRANNASLASATFLYVSKTNRAGSDIASKLLSLDDSTNVSRKAGLILTDPATEAQAFFDLSAITDATGYVKAAVSGHSGATSFANGIAISLQDARDGDKGADGAGTGDVVGPASVTDGRFALFDGTSGKLIKQHTGTPGALAVKSTAATSDIDNDAVTYAKMQNVSATDKLLGRASAGAGDPEEIACTAAGRALLDDADAATMLATLGAAALGTIVGIQLITATGTYTRTSGCTKALLIGQAAGGGGGGVGSTSGNAAAGYGGAGETRMAVISPGATESVTIGAVGSGASAGNNSGGTADDSSFGSHMTCKGGTGGGGHAGNGNGTTGTTPTGSGGIRIAPQAGGRDNNTTPYCSAPDTMLGGGGFSMVNTPGVAGSGYGGGGAGGVHTDTTQRGGGAGAAGAFLVIEFR